MPNIFTSTLSTRHTRTADIDGLQPLLVVQATRPESSRSQMVCHLGTHSPHVFEGKRFAGSRGVIADRVICFDHRFRLTALLSLSRIASEKDPAMATIDSAPAGGLRTQAPSCDAQLAAAFHRARSNNKPGIWRRKIEPVDGASDAAERELSFGPFRVLPARRLLLEDDKPVH